LISMSIEFVYLFRRVGKALALSCLAGMSAVAQAPHGPASFEEIVDASFKGSVRRTDANARATPESIRPDSMLNERPQSKFTGGATSLARLQNAPPPKAFRQMEKAQEALDSGDLVAGVKRLEKAIEIHPNFIEARNNLGVQYARLGRWKDAAVEFEQAAELDPAAALPHLNLALALQQLGEAEGAVANAEEAARLAPHDSGTHFNLGSILAQQGKRLSDAVRHLSRAEAAYPTAKIIKAEALLQQGKAADAQAALRGFLATDKRLIVR
jgi:tetratricopeptide (TPR) repeat protein